MSLFPQQNQASVDDLGTQSGATPAYVPLNPNSAAKQMAALNATSQLRRASQSGGTSDTTFGARQNSLDISTPDAISMTQQQREPDVHIRSRRTEFYKRFANLMSVRQTPLPASMTGIPSAYDHATSQWNSLEATAEPGGFKLMGRDIDLYKLWQLVIAYGGHTKVSREDGWITLLPPFGFNDETPESKGNVARALCYYYTNLLGPLEEAYAKSLQQHKALAQQRQSQQASNVATTHNPADSGMIDSSPQTSQTLSSSRSQSITTLPLHSQSETASSGTSNPEPSMAPFQGLDPKGNQPSFSNNHGLQNTFSTLLLDASQPSSDTNSHPTHVDDGFATVSVDNASDEVDTKKRKLQEEDTGKRAPKKESSESEQLNAPSSPPQAASTDVLSEVAGQSNPPVSRPSTSLPPPSKQPRMRRKVEYLPLAREVETFGGRDLEVIDVEISKLASRRTQRPVEEWGTIDVDGLTMSIRSRLPIELSYAITVLTILSTMRGQTPDTGFSLQQCEDLLDELLDLLREQAFGDADDKEEENETFWTHRELANTVRDNELQVFPGRAFVKRHVARHAELKPSAADIIFAVLNLFRNFSSTTENQRFMSQHPNFLDLLLRISYIPLRKETSLPVPASPVLSLPDIIKARRDVLTIVSNLVTYTILALHPFRVRTRLFELLASFLVEPHDLCSPAGIVMQSGAISAASVRPPLLVDLALEAFSKLSQPDNNRFALSRGINASWLWILFTSLVHRLPVSSEDFAITMRMHDVWLSYIEKVVLSIYSLCFLASPELKTQIKTDRTLGFTKLVLRMVKRFVSITHPEARQYFLVSSRRAIEALKLIDEGGDAFESPQTTGPVLAFGMGFGESDVQQAETGVGLLAAFQDDVTWTIMMMTHVDDVMFAELDSLSRINV
ncbi:hypothetical protein BU17DRAFT_81164 [Hysterangium stoloniferum]|nr:hypothetical protein BU17DRAFT_81164 [Hysterangium stoloniferum]